MSVCEILRSKWFACGAKQLSVDAMIPLLAVPLLGFLAAQSLFCTLCTFVATPLLIYYLHHNFLKYLLRTKFFLMWTIVSIFLLLVIFELNVVPLLEILPEENLLFILAVVGGLFCWYKTKLHAEDSLSAEEWDDEARKEEQQKLNSLPLNQACSLCRRPFPPRAYHCRICQTCVVAREYHCKWLDCCIGATNLKWFMGCLILSAIAFIYGSNLTMTSVCHPFILIGTILMPDDCSDVYHQLDIAICFVSAVYSLIIGLIMLYYFVYHLWLMYIGTTSNERRLSSAKVPSERGILQDMSRMTFCNA